VPRKSAASLAIVREVGPVVRLMPPAGLSAWERGLWLDVVNGKPAEWFAAEHEPLLRQYVKHAATARVLQAQIDEFDPEWLKDDDGLRRYDRLLSAHEREGRAMTSIATKMRLTQQSQYGARAASTASDSTGSGRKPWQTVDED
jgi:hypothetical protein